jgi:uncharacterized repeat protein (TIGR03806 family)
MNRRLLFLFVSVLAIVFACNKNGNNANVVEIPDFNYPETVVFEQNLSAYSIFDGAPANLIPSSDFHLVELSSALYTDHAHKQRLIKVPSGTQLMRMADGSIDFPDGTILVKTFYYYNNEQDTTQGKRILESRLLIKENGIWNVATYIWNQDQTDGILEKNGLDTQVSWVSADGTNLSTLYHVPDENECIACHQTSNSTAPIGPNLRNLNRTVERNGVMTNQIDHMQSLGILSSFSSSQEPVIPDYTDASNSFADRGRAYLDMNCAHCHNPTAWDIPAEKDFDFRFETPLDQTGIIYEKEKIIEALQNLDMPFIGVTLKDDEGITLITQYLENL